jgi:acetolactate synthase-1/2/3 large subunit
MASAQAEITGRPGACIATLGPGAASVMNGVANAWLDRVPLLVLTDCHGDAAGTMQHQTLAQGEMFRPVVKWSARLHPGNVDQVMRQAIAAVSSLPHGPVHLDVTPATAVDDSVPAWRPPGRGAAGEIPAVLPQARRPVFLLGLGARTPAIASTIRGMCERFGIPALVTYKAKGVVSDRHPWFGGVLTNGALEHDILERADLFLAVGLDPVELLPRPWTYPQPVIAINSWKMSQRQIPVAAELIGDVDDIAGVLRETEWTGEEVASLAECQRDCLRPRGEPGELLPHRVVELVAEAYAGARAAVDAGAHMFPVMSLWPAEEPCGVLISNGLATMGFGLPAAIGAALLDRSRPVVAFTGDGGLLMCLGELRTAAREGLPLRIILFEDGALSLIRIKQIQRGYRTDGVSIGDIDWRALGASMGMAARHCDSEDTLRAALRETAGESGPVLIAARISARTYPDMLRALRGNP